MHACAVDGADVTVDELPSALIGSDEPGSLVTLRVLRVAGEGSRAGARVAGAGGDSRPRLSRELKREEEAREEMLDVQVMRVESREIADKARLFALFTDIENHIDSPESCSQTEALQTVDNAIGLWTKMEQKSAARMMAWDDKQRQLEASCAKLEDQVRALQGDERVRELEQQLQAALFDACRLRRRYSRSVRASAPAGAESGAGAEEQHAAGLLRLRVEELEHELSDALRAHQRDGATDEDWRSRRQSVNRLKDARLVRRNVPLVERGGSVRWSDQADDASDASSRCVRVTTVCCCVV
jgi:hypothetical protein